MKVLSIKYIKYKIEDSTTVYSLAISSLSLGNFLPMLFQSILKNYINILILPMNYFTHI